MRDRTVGLVGIGLIGTALARRLLAAGFSVIGYDVDPAKRDALAEMGGAAAGSLAELGAAADRVLLAVFDTRQVEDVLESPDGLLAAVEDTDRKIFVSTSTCDPQRITALSERLRARRVTLLECPLSGTSHQVETGDGVGLVAGDTSAAAEVEDILAAICKQHYFMGALGNGNRAKLAINLILGLNRAALAEGLVFAERLGLPLEPFLDVARGSAAYSQIMDVKGAKMIAGDFAPHGKIAQSHKDFSLILGSAAAAGQRLPLATVYDELMQGCIDHGEGERDNAMVIEQIRRMRTA
jgi:3-hydroxyisobutyrate dehydrogenase-like beta-hydroxyacid dehydrogenase